uniref:Uncharacterized protein n=1 Tax=Cucumis sativus TaxID=3659 RepID=A0A0A0LD85_CUCSA
MESACSTQALLFLDKTLFLRLPSLDQLATPVTGAYFLILAVLILRDSWACCNARIFLSLELLKVGMMIGMNKNSVNSPGRPHIGNISANELTARSNKDGWENDWDV